MEIKGQLISEPLTCADRKQRQRMAELHERRRSLQALLGSRLAELRCICLQEAELTGAVPRDFPLQAGERPPCVRRRGGVSRQGNRKARSEEENSQRSKLKKTLFSAALRKHSESDNTHHGKRTVHRGCHTDDTVRSESSSTSGSTGLDNDEAVIRLPLLNTHGETLYQNKTRSSRHRAELHAPPQKPLSPSHPPPLHPPPPPPRHSQDSPEGEGGLRGSHSSDGLLERLAPPEQEALWVNGGSRGRGSNGLSEGVRERGGGYSEELLDYVWGKQQRPITAQQLYGAPPTYRHHHGDQRRVKVTRTKSCGPFLSPDTHNTPLPAIQPDPHPHLLPPQPPQTPPDAQLEDATRSLHKALALEGLRDWYLRNTLGSTHENEVKVNGGVTCQAGGRRRTHGIIQQSTNQKKTLPHSATFSGQTLHTRCADSALLRAPHPQKQEGQPSPGTLV
ncbi:hypothetical protein PBY51_018302 [Eleginops maclovinus]|nr:hypothetical protein PBY51_018302 [Eleginops maclovinus]